MPPALFMIEIEFLDIAGPGVRVRRRRLSFGPRSLHRGFYNHPKISFVYCPETDVVVPPGGMTAAPLCDPKVVAWVKTA